MSEDYKFVTKEEIETAFELLLRTTPGYLNLKTQCKELAERLLRERDALHRVARKYYFEASGSILLGGDVFNAVTDEAKRLLKA